MKVGEQTSRHLLLAIITTAFSVGLGLITLAKTCEQCMVPMIAPC